MKKQRDGGDPIVDGLRRLYDDVASEPVPDEFMNLLNKIDEVRAAKDGKKDGRS
jgi:hypothetical protein